MNGTNDENSEREGTGLAMEARTSCMCRRAGREAGGRAGVCSNIHIDEQRLLIGVKTWKHVSQTA